MPESKSQGKEKIWVVCADYDDCLSALNSEPVIDYYNGRDGNQSSKKIKEHAWLDETATFDTFRKKYAGHSIILNKIKNLQARLETVTGYWKTMDHHGMISKEKQSAITTVFKFKEELTHVCLMGDLLNAGYQPGEDIRIMNGSIRQNNKLGQIK